MLWRARWEPHLGWPDPAALTSMSVLTGSLSKARTQDPTWHLLTFDLDVYECKPRLEYKPFRKTTIELLVKWGAWKIINSMLHRGPHLCNEGTVFSRSGHSGKSEWGQLQLMSVALDLKWGSFVHLLDFLTKRQLAFFPQNESLSSLTAGKEGEEREKREMTWRVWHSSIILKDIQAKSTLVTTYNMYHFQKAFCFRSLA